MKTSDLKILIVDDNPEMRIFLADLCTINGYHAECAGNGAEALDLIRLNGTCDLAIVDFQMPEMQGPEFIRRVREEECDFPIIAMSGSYDVENSFIEAGANFFLRKPFEPHLLEKMIHVIVPAVPSEGRSRFKQ